MPADVVDDLDLGGDWTDFPVMERPDRRAWAAVVAAALLADLAVRSGVAGLAGALLVCVVAASLVASGRVARLPALGVVLAAVPFGVCLAVRTSPWLIPLDILAAGGLFAIGCSLARGGHPFDLTLPRMLTHAIWSSAHIVAGPAFLLRGLGGADRGTLGASVVRGGLLAAPIVVVLGVLLGSADPVFASFFAVPGDPVDWFVHLLLLGLGGWGMAGLLRAASAIPPPATPAVAWRLGIVETTAVLGGLVLLYAAFAVAQVVAVLGGTSRVASTTGLTYAEYARSGFFQLLAVAALTLLVLLGLRACRGGHFAGPLLLLAEAAVVLTLLIVVVAVRRLGLYEQAFGLTMLRLYSVVFALWIGAIFVLFGLGLAGVGRARAWLIPAAAAIGLAMLLGLNVANPEAAVVRRNVARAASGGLFDARYLADLSDDAVPALVSELAGLAPDARAEVVALVCGPSRVGGDLGGFWAYNGARDGATEARNQLCGQ